MWALRLGRCKCHGRKACVNGMLAARTVTVVTRRARQTRGFFQGKQFQVTWASSLLQARLMLYKCVVARVATHALSLRRASWRALGGELQSASAGSTSTARSAGSDGPADGAIRCCGRSGAVLHGGSQRPFLNLPCVVRLPLSSKGIHSLNFTHAALQTPTKPD